MLKVELRNVKHLGSASRETYCFTADIWLDGKKAGTAENSGRGGPNLIWPRDVEKKIEDYAKTLPPVKVDDMDLEMCADLLISELVTEFLLLKDMKRALKKKVLFTKKGTKGVFQITPQAPGLPALEASIARRQADQAVDKILNNMPEAEAFLIYKSGAK